jgi:DNA relaxase NicK
MGPQTVDDYNPVDAGMELYSFQQLAVLEAANPELTSRRRVALLMEREKTLRGQVVLAMSIAMGVSPDDWIELPTGHNFYAKCLLGPFGAKVDYSPMSSADGLHFNATLPGQACSAIGHERMVVLLKWQCRQGVTFTRLDPAMDDHTKVISVDDVYEAMSSEYVVTRAKKCLTVFETKVGTKEVTGNTRYLGVPGALNRMRVYDKDLESKGLVPANRFEMECRKESAETLGPLLAEGDWQKVIPQRFVSFVDFRDPNIKGLKEVEERPRLGWWSALVDNVMRVNMFAAKAMRTIEDKADWIKQSVAPTLAVVFEAMGGNLDELSALLSEGKKRCKSGNIEALRVWRSAGSKPLMFGFATPGLDRAREAREIW